MRSEQQKLSLLSTITGTPWKNIGVKDHHGINLPLFSLHTRSSAGIGEYLDLKMVIDWCKKIGLDIIQLLPLNDTGPEPSPYSAISAFALNPLHISLSSLSEISKYDDLQNLLGELQNLTKEQRVNYPLLHQKRDQFLHLYYEHLYPKESSKAEFIQFIHKYEDWLPGYALFKTIKIIRQWQPWEKWPANLRDPCPTDLARLYKEYNNQISYHIFLQYLCFKQMEEVKKYATENHIFLKGDIPILISKESADVWIQRNLFIMEFTAGAPPDVYSREGQNWEFPIYNWPEMERQHYNWWKKRLGIASQFYDIFRLDHIVGFFRIWSIPNGHKGLDGHFYPSEESKWVDLGTKNLMLMLQNCVMLPIGEDLGVVSTEIRGCLKKLGICGTKVMRWERYWKGDLTFINVKDYDAESMTTVSTHDSETLQMWWKNQKEEAQEYGRSKSWEYEPILSIEQRKSILSDSHHSNSLFHINLLNEYLALIPGMTWPNPEDERINNPSTPTNKNWTYRFLPSFEQIAENLDLESLIKKFIRP